MHGISVLSLISVSYDANFYVSFNTKILFDFRLRGVYTEIGLRGYV